MGGAEISGGWAKCRANPDTVTYVICIKVDSNSVCFLLIDFGVQLIRAWLARIQWHVLMFLGKDTLINNAVPNH